MVIIEGVFFFLNGLSTSVFFFSFLFFSFLFFLVFVGRKKIRCYDMLNLGAPTKEGEWIAKNREKKIGATEAERRKIKRLSLRVYLSFKRWIQEDMLEWLAMMVWRGWRWWSRLSGRGLRGRVAIQEDFGEEGRGGGKESANFSGQGSWGAKPEVTFGQLMPTASVAVILPSGVTNV